MSKEQYLRMCEQTGEEIDWEKCPPEGEDFPETVISSIGIFNQLGNRMYGEVGFVGKDYTNLDFVLKANKITEKEEKEWVFEILLFLETRAIAESQKQLKASYDKMKKK